MPVAYAKVPSRATTANDRTSGGRRHLRHDHDRRPACLQTIHVECHRTQCVGHRVDQMAARHVVGVTTTLDENLAGPRPEVENDHLRSIAPPVSAVMVNSTAVPPGSSSGQT